MPHLSDDTHLQNSPPSPLMFVATRHQIQKTLQTAGGHNFINKYFYFLQKGWPYDIKITPTYIPLIKIQVSKNKASKSQF